MRDEGFLSPAGRRFIAVAALLLLCGVIVYYVLAEEGSFEFLEDLGPTETTTSSTTFTVPEVDVPDFSDPQAPPEIDTAEDVLDCLEDAAGDIESIQACANPG